MKKPTKKEKLTLKAKQSAINFKKELKKSILTAMVAAFGFLIALSWRDLITQIVNNLSSVSPLQGTFVQTMTITIISVVGILVITKLFQEKSEKQK